MRSKEKLAFKTKTGVAVREGLLELFNQVVGTVCKE
jgi:hypothetical protein